MVRRSNSWFGSALTLVGLLFVPCEGEAQSVGVQDVLEARIWFDRGDTPIVRQGDQVRIYYRASHDAYVAIFNIDTNGTSRLVFPRSPTEEHVVTGGRDYRLLFPRSPYWYVDDPPGLGYYFILASPEPFDFSGFDYSYFDRGWNLTRVGQNVYTDPYVAMDDYVAALIPDWEYVPYALDFSEYHVGDERYDYPRFLCYDCHGFRPYSVWNPYLYACTDFRVVVYTDPYYYPVYRYRGDQVVYVRPPQRGLPRFEFKERVYGEPAGPRFATRPPPQDRPGLPDGLIKRSTARTGGSAVVSPRSSVSGSGVTGSASDRRGGVVAPRRGGIPAVVPARPSDALPGRSTSSQRSTGSIRFPPGTVFPRARVPDARRPATGSSEDPRTRPVLERRPSSGSRGNSGTSGGTTSGSRPPTTVRPPTRGSGGSESQAGIQVIRGRPPTSIRGGTVGRSTPTQLGPARTIPKPSTARRPVATRPTSARVLPRRPSQGGGGGAGAVRPGSGSRPPAASSRPPARSGSSSTGSRAARPTRRRGGG